MRTFLALTLVCGALFVSGCFGSCGTTPRGCPPPPPPPRPAQVYVKPAPVIRPAPPLPPAVCDPCAGF